MIRDVEAKFLEKIPEDQIVEVVPWDPKGLQIAEGVIADIKSVDPEADIIFIGSLPLRIAGQRDIDLSILSQESNFPTHRQKLETVFGQPDKLGKTSIAWHFNRHGYEVGIYLTDPITSEVQRQIDVFNLLKNNPNLLKEYEQIKLSAKDKSYREYQTLARANYFFRQKERRSVFLLHRHDHDFEQIIQTYRS
jgi:GrpB-like predicted nucleotidyltransferase (UPF0157 family)